MASDASDGRGEKEAASALRTSEERLRSVLNSMAEGFALLAPDFTILDVNEESTRLDGRPREQMVGQSHWHAFPGTEHSPLGDLYRRVMGDRTPGAIEFRYHWPDGRDMWVDVRAYPTPDGNMAVFWRDSTDRRRIEERIRENERKYRTLFESIDEGFVIAEVIVDESGHAVDALYLEGNPAASRLTAGRSYDHRLLSELVPGAERYWLEIYGRVAQTGITERLQRYLEPLGRWYDFHISRITSRDGQSGRPRIAVVFQDVSEQTRAEAALRDSEERLRKLNEQLEGRVRQRTSQVRSLFQRLVSAQEKERARIARDIHDNIGQQMTALRMHLEALRTQSAGRPALIAQTERIHTLAEELDQSIDFLTWELRPAALDHLGLPASLQNLVTGWSERFSINAGFTADGVGEVRLPPDVEANLYRIAQEALHNIAKHSGATHATVTLARRDRHLALTVEDDGGGFDARASAMDGSSGFGLVSMRERAALVGGELDIQSSAGRGTVVSVRIPDAGAE